MSAVMGIASLVAFCLGLFIAVVLLVSAAMLVPMGLHLRQDARRRTAVAEAPAPAVDPAPRTHWRAAA